jgi:hypothetical protein
VPKAEAATAVAVKVEADNTIVAGVIEVDEAVEAAEVTHRALVNIAISTAITEATSAQLVEQWPRTLISIPPTCSLREVTPRYHLVTHEE